jgi:hypothetical protein
MPGMRWSMRKRATGAFRTFSSRTTSSAAAPQIALDGAQHLGVVIHRQSGGFGHQVVLYYDI